MRHWLLALEFVWLNHRSDFVGLGLCVAIASGLFGAGLSIGALDLSMRPAVSTPSEGRIIGFVGGSSRFSTGVSAYIRARDNNYGFVFLPFASGCQNGDRIAVDEWQMKGRLFFRVRPPGCTRNRGGI